jgi:uncharacterized protein YdaU (DUF1376 family)
MSCAEVGAYIRLLCSAWDSTPEATIPADSEKVRRIAGADPAEWEQISTAVLEKWGENKRFPGRLMNKRLRETFEEVDEYSGKLKATASERGRKGAAARWGTKPPDVNMQAVREEDEA